MPPPPSRFDKIKGHKAQLFALGKKNPASAGTSASDAASSSTSATAPRVPPKRPHAPPVASTDASVSPVAKKKRADPRLQRANAPKPAVTSNSSSSTSGISSLFGKGSSFSVVGAKNRPSASTSGTSVDVVGGGRVGSFLPTSSSFSTASVSSLLNEGVFSVDLQTWKVPCSSVQFSVAEFTKLVEAAKSEENSDQLAKIICCALKAFLAEHASAPVNPTFSSTIRNVFLKEKEICEKSMVQSALFSTLHTMGTSPEREKLSDRIGLIIGLLETMLNHLTEWPLGLVSLAVADSLDKRGWIDHIAAAGLVSKIFSAFGTRFPTDEMLNTVGISFLGKRQIAHQERFNNHSKEISCMRVKLADILEKCLQRDSLQKESLSKNAIRTISLCCGFSEFRLMAIKRLDSWLLNAKFQRCAIELFMFLASNAGSQESEGYSQLMKFLVHMKSMSSKQIANVYQVAIKEIVRNDDNSIAVLAGHLLDAEFTDHKSGYCMPVLHNLFIMNQRKTSQVLADKFVKMMERDDTFRMQKVFIKEFVRTYIRSDFLFASFAKDIFNAVNKRTRDDKITRALLQAVIDTTCTFPFLSLSGPIRQAYTVRRSGPVIALTSVQIDAITRYHTQLLEFFVSAISWLKAIQIEDARNAYYAAFYKVLFHAPLSEYVVATDGFPTEQDFTLLLKLCAEVQIGEGLLQLLIDIGLNHELPIDVGQILDLIGKTTFRTLHSNNGFKNKGQPLVLVKNCSLIDQLFQLTSYRGEYPQRPVESCDVDVLSVKENYWRAWLIVLVWSYMNKVDVLPNAYDRYSTLRMIIQMAVTKDYSFPPPSFGPDSSFEKLRETEEQLVQRERKTIADVESRTYKMLRTTENARLLNRLCFNNPSGPIRAPTEEFFAELRNINEAYHLGAHLCQCSTPDILLDLIRDQGIQRAMPSIARILSNTPEAIHHLPLFCLAQIFIYSVATYGSHTGSETLSEETLGMIIKKIRNHFKCIDGRPSIESVKELIFYIIGQLGASTASQREAAVYLLTRLFQGCTPENVLGGLKDMIYFAEIKHEICILLVNGGCSVEPISELLHEYLTFVRTYLELQSWHEISVRLSFLVAHCAESDRMVSDALLMFYADYLKNAMSGGDKIAWNFESTCEVDRLRVQLESSTYDMTSQAVAAIVKLLCFGQINDGSADHVRKELMSSWFPTDERKRPKVEKYGATGDLVKVDLLPNDLKKKMFYASDERIANAAIEGVGPREALRFIRAFGHSPLCSRKLLEIIENNADSLQDADTDLVKKGAPFVESYASGINMDTPKFTNCCKMLLTRVKNEEVGEISEVVTLLPLSEPVAEDVPMEEECDLSSEENVSRIFDEVCSDLSVAQAGPNKGLGGSRNSSWSKLMLAIANDLKVAQIALSSLEKHAKTLLEFGQVDLLVLLTKLSMCSQQYAEIKPSLLAFAEKLEKMSPIPTFVLAILKKILPTSAKSQFKFRRSVPDMQRKFGRESTCLDADILAQKQKVEESEMEFQKVAERDKYLHQLIVQIFAEFERGESVIGKASMEKLSLAAKQESAAFARQIPMLTANLCIISQLPLTARKLKDMGYVDAFHSILTCIEDSDPCSFDNHTDILGLMEFCFEFFKNKIAKTKTFYVDLVKAIAKVCLLYLQRCQPQAQNYLLQKITYLIEMKNYCHDFAPLRLIIDSLPNCPEKQALNQQSSHQYHRDSRDSRRDRDHYRR